MRLTLVISNLTSGGAQRVMSIMANHWAGEGVSVSLLSLVDTEKPFFPLHPGVAYRALNYSWGRRGMAPSPLVFLVNLVRLRRALLATKPDAVISFLDETNIRVLLSLAGSGVPVLVSERNDPFERKLRGGWDRLRRWTYPLARGVAIQTERAARYFRPHLDEKLVVIPNPVLVPDGGGSGENFPLEGRTVISVGKLHPQKGFDLLVRAFSGIALRNPGWNLIVFGEGEERAPLERLVEGLGLSGRIRFPGRVANPYAVLKRADLYVSSSRYEGFPNALCEAMACGLPVVATDCPSGPREIITDGVDGVLVSNGDAGALGDAMERLMGDDALRRGIGAHAARITQRFGTGAIMAQWEAALREKCGV